MRGTPRYTWLAPGGAVAYLFEYNDSSVVDADGAFIDPLHLTAEELTTNTYTPPPQALGTYYWHVKARDAAGNWGTWSAPREVTILPLIPLAPSLDIPLNNTLFNESNVDLTWKAAEAGVRYRVQVSTSYLFTSTAVDTTMGEGILTTTVYDLANNKYYWRVKALNIYGEEGPWSGYWSFTVDTSAPNAETLQPGGWRFYQGYHAHLVGLYSADGEVLLLPGGEGNVISKIPRTLSRNRLKPASRPPAGRCRMKMHCHTTMATTGARW